MIVMQESETDDGSGWAEAASNWNMAANQKGVSQALISGDIVLMC